jgi:hypothetical protein
MHHKPVFRVIVADFEFPPVEYPDRIAAAIEKLAAHQSPSDCSASTYLVVDTVSRSNTGMGAHIHRHATWLNYARHLGRVLVMDLQWRPGVWWWDDKEFCTTSGGTACYYRSLSPCWEYARDHKNEWKLVQELAGHPEQFISVQGTPWSRMDKPEARRALSGPQDFPAPRSNRNGIGGWKSVTLGFLMGEPNTLFAKWLQQESAWAKGREHQISVHIRWGDKIADSNLHPISAYVNAVEQIIERHSIENPQILVTSETQFAIDSFKAAAHADWSIDAHEEVRCYGNDDMDMIYDVENLVSGDEPLKHFQRSKWNGQYQSFNKCGNVAGKGVRIAMNSLLNLHLSRTVPHTVYTSKSNWGRVITYLKGALRPLEEVRANSHIDLDKRSSTYTFQ